MVKKVCFSKNSLGFTLFLQQEEGKKEAKKEVVNAKHIGFAFLKRNKLKQQKQAISTQKLRVWHEKHKLLAPKLLCFSPQYIVFFTLNS